MLPSTWKMPPQPPPDFNIEASSVLDEIAKILDQVRKLQDRIVAEIKPDGATFENVLLPQIHLHSKNACKLSIFARFRSLKDNEELWAACRKGWQLIEAFEVESGQREDMFKLVDAVLHNDKELDPESQYLLERRYRDYIRNGLKIPEGPERARFAEVKKELSVLLDACRATVFEDLHGIWLTREELDGVPDDIVDGFQKGEGEDAGKIWLPFKTLDVPFILSRVTKTATRKAIYIANDRRCPENVERLQRVVVLRDEAARLLGFPSHAALKLEDKMAKTVETVDYFLTDLRDKITAVGQQHIANLVALKRQDLLDGRVACGQKVTANDNSDDSRLFLWDWNYYHRMWDQRESSFDPDRLAEYFPLETTLSGILGLYEHLFGVHFEEIPKDQYDRLSGGNAKHAVTWHPDVKLFTAWDTESEGGAFLGYLYLDLLIRETGGAKVAGSHFCIQPGYTKEDGTRHFPVSSVKLSFSRPTAEKPTLLKGKQVRSLLHELGHAMHCLVSRTNFAGFHGTKVSRDFVEIPSIMIENWFWIPTQMKGLSYHYSYLSDEYMTSWKREQADQETVACMTEKLPDDVIESVLKTRYSNWAKFYLTQVHYSLFDMMIHSPSSLSAAKEMELTKLWNTSKKDILMLDGPEVLGDGDEWGFGQARYNKMFTSYDVGYYSYPWSMVISTDIFHTMFQSDPMNQEVARRYRYTLLQPGGSQPEEKSLEDFLGRKPNSDAFFESVGLSVKR